MYSVDGPDNSKVMLVCFHDADGVTVAVGMVENGSEEMSRSESFKGVIPGEYKVSVMSWLEFPGMTQPNGSVSKGMSRVPLKYTTVDKSGLSTLVDGDGGTVDFVLEGQTESVGSSAAKRATAKGRTQPH